MMKRHIIPILMLALALNASAQTRGLARINGAQTQVWVSPTGEDGKGTGSQSSPFASLERALQYVRQLRQEHTSAELGEVHVILRGGTYRLSRTIELSAEDNGTLQSPTIIEAADGEQPVLSGGVKVDGWQQAGVVNGLPEVAQGKVWVADTPQQDGQQVRFRQMWVDGTKMRRASTFDDYSMPQIVTVDKDAQTLTIPRPKMDLSQAKHLEMWIPQDWALNILRVNGISHKNEHHSVLSFEKKEADIEFKRPWPILKAEYGAHYNHRYFLANAIELLNRPQEWYNDVEANKLYYWPRYGETQNGIEAVVPHLETLVKIDGTLDNMTSNIQFRGIIFEHTTWMRPTDEGHVPLQAGQWLYDAWSEQTETANNVAWVGRPAAAISVQNAHNISFEKCWFRHMGSTAVDFVSGTHNTAVRGCVFTDIAGNGVCGGYFGDEHFESHVAYNPADLREACDSMFVENCYIVEPGNEDWGCHGVGVGFASNVNILHNEIVDAPYSSISVGWGWIHTDNVMHDNHIDYNHVNGFAVYMRDCGGLYTLSPQRNSTMHGNWIEKPGDSEMTPLMWNMKSAQADIYADEGTDYFTVTDNWCSRGDLAMNQNGGHNTWSNNSPNVSTSICDNAGLEPDYRYIRDMVSKPSYAPVDSIGDRVNADRDQIDFVAQDDGFKLGSVLAVDLNNDNRRDIVYSGGEAYQVHAGGVRMNTGDYSFAATQKLTHANFGNFAAGDLDGDGYIDLVQAGYDFWDSFNAVLMNDGKGRLTTSQLPRSSSTSPACGIADINQDGLPDYFFIGNGTSNNFYMQKSDRSGFKRTSKLTLPGGFENPSMIYADFDNNQTLDLCLLSSKTNGVYTRMHMNDGKGNFTEKSVGFQEKGTRGGLAYADVNGDGWLDVAVGGKTATEEWNTPGSQGGMTVTLYLNQGNGTFKASQQFSEYLQDNVNHPFRFVDWNNDGYTDLILAGWNISYGNIAQVDVYLNDGTGNFTKSDVDLPGVSEVSLDVADFTGNGINDILITGNANGAMGFHGYDVDRRLAVLCKNHTDRHNTSPLPPTQLSSEIDGSVVRLQWNAGSDAETPAKSLSYNYYIRNVETGVYLTFPNSDVATGVRRVSDMGNAWLNLGWTLSNLPVGTYAWSVQTVDAGYAGSAFAPEQTFTITESQTEVETNMRDRMLAQGWTKITELPADLGNYYFAVFDHTEDMCMVKNDGDANAYYAEGLDPTTAKKAVWTITDDSPSNNGYYLLTNLDAPNYTYMTEWNQGWYFHTSDNNEWWSCIRPTYSLDNDSWTYKLQGASYLGAWDGDGAHHNERIAGNKDNNETGQFDMYAMPRSTWMMLNANLAAASAGNPVDITYMITNADAEWKNSKGWTVTGTALGTETGSAMSNRSGNTFFNLWDNYAVVADRTATQTLTNMPAGKYRLSVACDNRDGGTTGFYILIGDQVSSAVPVGQTTQILEYELTEAGDLTFGVKFEGYPGNDAKFDNVKLYLVDYAAPVTKGELETLIDEVSTLYTPEKAGNTGYYSEAAYATLRTAIQTAEAEAAKTKDDYKQDVKALLDAKDALLDSQTIGTAPVEGYYDITVPMLHEAGRINGNGQFTRADENNGSRFQAPKYWMVENSYGDRPGLDNDPGYWCLGLERWGHGTTTNARIYQQLTLPAGKYYFGRDMQSSDKAGDMYIFASTSLLEAEDITSNSLAYENLSVGGSSEGSFHGINFTLTEETTLYLGFQADFSTQNNIGFRVRAVKLQSDKELSIARTTSTDMLGTICVPFAATADGATVYSAEVNGNYVVLTEVGTQLEAGIPYIYQATSGAQAFTYKQGDLVDSPSDGGILKGIFSSTVAPAGSYVMQTQGGIQKFYRVVAGDEPTIAPYRAYLQTSSNAKALGWIFNDETDIDAPTSPEEVIIYDLQGRKLNRLQKGINIVNNVKLLVK